MRLSRLFVWIVFGALLAGLALPLASFATWMASPGEMIGTAWLVAGFGAAGYGCALARERGRAPRWMASAVATAVVGFLVFTAMIWVPRLARTAPLVIAGGASAGWTLIMMFTAALLLLRLSSRPWRVVRVVTIVCAATAIAGATMTMTAYAGAGRLPYDVEEMLMRGVTIAGILACCGTVALVIGAVIPRIAGEAVPDRERLSFRITCPRCGRVQRLRTEGDQCAACGLRIKVCPT